jgi:hypothetical protein
MYSREHLKSDGINGLFNGSLFSLCWGITNGSYYSYSPDITKMQYAKGISKYILRSNLQIVPVFTLARIVHNYCKEEEFNLWVCAAVTFGISCIGFAVLEFGFKKVKF